MAIYQVVRKKDLQIYLSAITSAQGRRKTSFNVSILPHKNTNKLRIKVG